ncbi:MAG: histidine phosphatase family protein [Phototrophicaceae bacterium]
MAERHITLIRHGDYDKSATDIGGGDLTPTGIEQAERVAQALVEQYPVTAIYSSTLRRAISTAHIIAIAQHKVGFSQDENLCEAVFHIPPKDEAYFAQFKDLGSEAITAQRIRVAHAYQTYVVAASTQTDEHDVLVAHGNIIRYFVVRAMNAPIDLWTQMDIYNGGITRLLVREDGQVKLVTHNEIGHLPRRLWSV